MKKLIFFMFLTSIIVTIYPQIVNDENSPYAVYKLNQKDDLPQNQIYNILPGENNEILLQLSNGLYTYNGHRFKSYSENTIYKSIFLKRIIRNNNLLIGITDDYKIYLLEPYIKKVDINLEPSEFIQNGIICNNSFYFITNNGNLYRKKSVEELELILSIDGSFSNIENKNELIYLSSNDGFYIYDNRLNKLEKISSAPTTNILSDNFNNLYIINSNQIYEYNNNKLDLLLTLGEKNKIFYINDIVKAPNNELFIATSEGLYHYDYKTKKTVKINHKDVSFKIECLYYDNRSENLYIGTNNQGIVKLINKKVSTISTSAEQKGSFTSIIQLKNGDIISSKYCCNTTVISDGKLFTHPFMKWHVGTMSYIDEKIYVGEFGPKILLINPNNTIDEYEIQAQIVPQGIFSIFKSSRDEFWVGTNRGLFKGKTINSLKPFYSNLVNGKVCIIYQLKNGNICAGGSDGLCIISNDKIIKRIPNINGSLGREIRSIYEDKLGRIWFGSYNKGLYCFENNIVTSINKKQGCMLSENIFTLVPDNYGYMYITTNNGLYRIKEKSLFQFYENKIKYLVPFVYTEKNGLLSTEFNGGFQNNYLKSKDGTIYFPSNEGIVKVENNNPNYTKKMVQIDQIVLNDSLINPEKTTFDKGTYSIEFNFSSTELNSEENSYYQYKLERNNEKAEWSHLQKKSEVKFIYLPSGDYSLKVRVINAFNDENPNETEYNFTIESYFYERIEIQLIAIVILIGLIVAIFQIISLSRKVKKDKESKLKIKMAEVELKAIQAQLNPHFIFNCMNSLKYFIISKNHKGAEKFLNHLSNLLRRFLEYSNSTKITIEQEVNIITQYLELEKMRNDNFSYEIVFDPEVKFVTIPSMLTQPFIENSIIHGFDEKIEGGIIHIHFILKNDKVICKIEDNGIGRKKAMLNKAARDQNNYESKGIKIIEDKIYVFNQLENKNIFYIIVDKYDSDNNPSGTIVEINIDI